MDILKGFFKSKKRRNSENDVYNNTTYRDTIGYIRKQARKKKRQSQHPEKTGVIPLFYNSNRAKQGDKYDPISDSDSDFSDDDSVQSEKQYGKIDLSDPLAFYKQAEAFNNMDSNNPDGNFEDQFDPLSFDNKGGPTSINNVGKIYGDNGSKRLSMERNLALGNGFSNFAPNEDQTYGIVDKEHFVHNNMTPNFSIGSKTYGFDPQFELHNTLGKQRKLETFTGSADNLDFRPNSERKPMFDPVVGLHNMFGMPNINDVMDSRYIPSMNRQGEKPFQPVKVTPGLNLGYNEVGRQGYHDSFRVLPKTIDELRGPLRRQQSYTTPVIQGMKGQRGAVPQQMFKRRPLNFRETHFSEGLKGRSNITGPVLRQQFDPANIATVNRGVEVNGRMGTAKTSVDQHVPENMISKSKVSLKENFAYDGPRNVYRHEGLNARDDDSKYNPRGTQRSQQNQYIGHAHGSTMKNGQAFDYINAIPDPNMRNIHDQYNRNGNVANRTQTYAFDNVNAIPDPNMRNIHDQYNRNGNIANRTQTYAFDNVNAIPDPNMRNIHDRYNRNGNVANRTQTYTFDSVNAIPDPNMRNIHDQYNRNGNMANRTQTYAFDSVNAIPDPNMRNIHDQYNRNGNMANRTQTYAFDSVNAVPDPNMRNIHDQYNRNGNVAKRTQTYAFDSINAIPDPTMRDIHGKTDRNGNVANGTKTYAFDSINAIPDPTMRDIHGKTDRVGVIRSNVEKQRSRGDANNMRVNTTKEVISKGRNPTTCNTNMIPTMNMTMMTLKEPLNFTRQLYPDIQDVSTERMCFDLSRQRIQLPNPNDEYNRFTSHVMDNLQGNPYINGPIHSSETHFLNN